MKHFVPGWKMTLMVAVLLPALISLGLWQLGRGAEKRGMEMDYLGKLTALPVAPDRQALATPFQRVRLQGRFAQETFLVDNQVVDGSQGYWLVQVFDEVSGRRFLTNRGFVRAPESRAQLPDIDSPAGTVHLIGTVWPFTGLVPLLDDDVWTDGWPKRVQRLDTARMAVTVGAVPMEIRLEPGQPGVRLAAPFAQVLSDAKHMGYAATWFGLAIALAVGYAIFGYRNAKEREKERNAAIQAGS